MVTLCNVQDVLDRIGVNANSTIAASTSIVERYIGVSEGIVCSETRIDFITSYSNLSTNVKNLLTSCVSSHAARNIIMYDPDAIGRSTAIVRINVNENEFQRNLKALKDVEVNKQRTLS